MFGINDDGQGAIRQLAWYIWQYRLRNGYDAPAIENWVIAERFFKFGERPDFWSDPSFMPFNDPNTGA